MQVTIKVGESEESLEVCDDLLTSPAWRGKDRRQDEVLHQVGARFTRAYMREARRTRTLEKPSENARETSNVD